GRWECSYGSELQGKVLGLAGYGGIGGRVAAMGRALGMHVHATRTRPSGPLSPSAEEVEFMELREVCGSADFLSVHLRDFGAGKPIIDAGMLGLMKPGAFLIN